MLDLDKIGTADATWLGFVEHLRFHNLIDKPILENIKLEQGRLTRATAREIAISYQVARNFPSKVEDRYDQIAHAVNATADIWPCEMADRIDACLELVDTIHTQIGTRNRTFSAATKFLWFVRPHHWLPYDRHAANGLVAHAPGAQRMRRYFKQLARSNFSATADRMTEIMRSAGFSELSGERVIDKALMIRGLRKRPTKLLESIIFDNFIYLSNMLEKERSAIREVANQLAEECPDAGVPQEQRLSHKRGRRSVQ